MKHERDESISKPLGPPIRKPEPPKPAPTGKSTNLPLPPVNIQDMDMIRKDFGNTPPPWGIFGGYQVVRVNVLGHRGTPSSPWVATYRPKDSAFSGTDE